MIPGLNPILQGFLGTLFTWFLTALGAGIVFFLPSNLTVLAQKKLLDASLGFAGGVMVAASYWSLLAPAIEIAAESGVYGAHGEWAFVPVSIGLIFGALFVYVADLLLPQADASTLANVASDHTEMDVDSPKVQGKKDKLRKRHAAQDVEGQEDSSPKSSPKSKTTHSTTSSTTLSSSSALAKSWRRILLLVLAITVHNFPEGLAVGVGFGATPSQEETELVQSGGASSHGGYSFQAAQRLAIGIGLQNFPEGLAVSLPLLRLGYSPMKSFWYGQLSGMVEPVGGVLGAAAVQLAKPCLPYTLAFAAGAMLYVVVQELIPESHTSGNPRLASGGFMFGFIVMMSLDVALG